MKKHIRREEHNGLWYWAVYHCHGCCKYGTNRESGGIDPLLFLVPHFNSLKEYVKRPR